MNAATLMGINWTRENRISLGVRVPIIIGTEQLTDKTYSHEIRFKKLVVYIVQGKLVWN